MPRHPRKESKKTSARPSNHLEDASKRKKSAEKRGPSPMTTMDLRACIQDFTTALAHMTDSGKRVDILFEIAESLQLMAESVLGVALSSSGSPIKSSHVVNVHQSRELEAIANQEAEGYLRQAHQAYEEVLSTGAQGSLRHAAFVNGSNVLVSLADVIVSGSREAAMELLAAASKRYEQARIAEPDDVEVITNMADCYSKLSDAIVPMEAGEGEYSSAMAAYELACSMADVRHGDDLPGLLHNWALALMSRARKCGNVEEMLNLFTRAEEKLRNSCEFRNSDMAPRLALGDALMEQADVIERHCGSVEDVRGLLDQSIREGFAVVLQFDGSHVEAHFGTADARLAMGKLSAKIGDREAAFSHWQQSVASYEAAVSLIESGKECELSFEEQCDALYNLACAASLLGDEQTAAQTLARLNSVEYLQGIDLNQDVDFELMRGKDWFISLCNQCSLHGNRHHR